MKFQRGQDPKEAMGIGLPVYDVYRLRQYRYKPEPGFYLISTIETEKALEKLSKCELDRAGYIIEFNEIYSVRKKNGYSFSSRSIIVHELHPCYLKYNNKRYLIKYYPEENEL